MNDPTRDESELAVAFARAQAPGILLMVVAGLNLAIALWMGAGAAIVVKDGDTEIDKIAKDQWRNMSPAQQKQLVNAGWDEETYISLFRGSVRFFLGWAVVSALCSLIVFVGGWKMIKLRSRGVAITGAILAIIPGLSCLSCVPVGTGIGIWCLVVLCSQDLLRGFQMNAHPPAPFDDSPPM